MRNKDDILLENAYMSVSQPVPPLPAAAPVGEITPPMAEEPESDSAECQEDELVASNIQSLQKSLESLNSCQCHLEPWAQQKLAIAADSLAEIVRRLPGAGEVVVVAAL